MVVNGVEAVRYESRKSRSSSSTRPRSVSMGADRDRPLRQHRLVSAAGLSGATCAGVVAASRRAALTPITASCRHSMRPPPAPSAFGFSPVPQYAF
ncbi:hypothetical protein EJB05_14407 [Eragrostis curvula]|uniref:Uncharacterized protein n=1 Tax=Eragrostis curvula TaxID=38414 RepID=A0A5J9VWX6_9POAL|nr:hypothetical protein EJB05_14407 [Eragrostis curvula]